MFKKIIVFFFVLILSTTLFAVDEVWMRTDADASEFYMWFGGTGQCPFLDKPLMHDIIYYPSSNAFETELGPAFNFGNLDVVPMLGIWYNMKSGETEYFMPQIYFYYRKDNIYIETWNILSQGTASNTNDEQKFNGRYFMKVSGIVDWMSFGPQIEFTYDFDDDLDEHVTSLPVGARLSFPYGNINFMEFFLGIETKDDNKFTSRVTFIKYF